MQPSDKTPAPDPNQRTRESYKTENKSQELQPIAKRDTGRKVSDDLSRLYFLYITHPTDETLHALVCGCLLNLKKITAYYVHVRRIYPSFLSPDTFAEDAFSLAVEKFWGGIHDVRAPKKLMAWLKVVGHSAVVEEFIARVRRTKEGPVRWESMEREVQEDGD